MQVETFLMIITAQGKNGKVGFFFTFNVPFHPQATSLGDQHSAIVFLCDSIVTELHWFVILRSVVYLTCLSFFQKDDCKVILLYFMIFIVCNTRLFFQSFNQCKNLINALTLINVSV